MRLRQPATTAMRIINNHIADIQTSVMMGNAAGILA